MPCLHAMRMRRRTPAVALLSVTPSRSSPTHQQRGAGLRLLAAAGAACQTPRLFTSTNPSNLAAQKLMLKAGFVRSGQIDNLDEHDPELVYVKYLC